VPDVEAAADRLADVQLDLEPVGREERARPGDGRGDAAEGQEPADGVHRDLSRRDRDARGLQRPTGGEREKAALNTRVVQQEEESRRHEENGEDERLDTPGAGPGDLCAAGHTSILGVRQARSAHGARPCRPEP
jgi:hypothetical protein